MKKAKVIGFILVAMLTVSSCVDILRQGEDPTASVRFLVQASHRGSKRMTAMPAAAQLVEASYQISASGPGGESFVLDTGNGDPLSKDGLTPGTWSFDVIANNESGTRIASGSIDDYDVAGGTNQVQIHMVLESGSGTLSLSLSLPSDVADGVSSVEGKLVAGDSSEIPLILHKTQPTIWDYASSTILAGEYFLFLEVKDDSGTKIATATGSVWVFALLETSDSIVLDPAEVNAPPAAPSALVAGSVAAETLSLGWNDNSDTETGFIVERADGAGAFAVMAMLGPNEVAWIDSTVFGSESYSYRVVATSPFGPSDYSETAPVSTPSGGIVSVPSFSSATGTYHNPLSITITSIPGASIEFSTDGIVWSTFSSALAIDAPVALQARAKKRGWVDSETAAATYGFQAAQPTFGTPAGVYGSAQSIVLGSASSGATILYTTDGGDPLGSGTEYSGAIQVTAADTTVRTVAMRTGWAPSGIAEARYRIPWTTTVLATAGQQPFIHAARFDSSGRLHIVYRKTDLGVRYLLVDGATHADTQVLPPIQDAYGNYGFQDNLAMEIDTNDVLHLAYREAVPLGTGKTNYSLKYLSHGAGGWSTPVSLKSIPNITESYAGQFGPRYFPAIAITVTADGSLVHIVTSDVNSLKLYYLTWNGSVSTEIANPGAFGSIAYGSKLNNGLSIALNASGYPYIAALGGSSGRVQQWNGSAWISPPGVIANGQVGTGLPTYEPHTYSSSNTLDIAIEGSAEQLPCLAYSSADGLVYLTKPASGAWTWEIVADCIDSLSYSARVSLGFNSEYAPRISFIDPDRKLIYAKKNGSVWDLLPVNDAVAESYSIDYILDRGADKAAFLYNLQSDLASLYLSVER